MPRQPRNLPAPSRAHRHLDLLRGAAAGVLDGRRAPARLDA